VFVDKAVGGWVAWGETITAYRVPHPTKHSLKPWEKDSEPAVEAIRKVALVKEFWKNLSTHFAAETNSESVTSDNVATVKSIGALMRSCSWLSRRLLMHV
jgi:proteasome activator subunit 4